MRNFNGRLLIDIVLRGVSPEYLSSTAGQRHRMGHCLDKLLPQWARQAVRLVKSADASNFLCLFITAVFKNYFRLIYICLFSFVYIYLLCRLRTYSRN